MRYLLSLLTLIAATAHAPDAHAYKAMGIKWSDAKMPIAWSLDVDGVDNITTSADNDEVKRAVKAWHDVDCSRLTFATPSVLPAGSGQNATGDGVNKVFWVESGWQYGNGTLGVTTPKYSGSQIFDADIEFNGVDYNWSTGQGNYCSGYCTDVFSIALHEFGHFFGLDHSTSQAAIMYASYPGFPKQALSNDDVTGICAIYPRPQPNTVSQGGACTQASDCVTGQGLTCAVSQAGDSKICTKTCTGTSDTSCPAGFKCRAASTGFACFEEQGGSGGGLEDAPCGQTIGGCSGSLVCVGSGSTGTCQRTCNPSAPNCPAGKTCYGTGGGTGACFPGSSGGEGDACGSTGCGSGLQCVGTSAADAKCRRTCTVGAPNPCPANFACTPISNNSSVCIPSSTPAGAAECQTCGQGVSCGSGLSCVADGDGKSRCRKSCLEDDACGTSNRCIARSDIPGGSAACACPGVAVDARAEGEACLDSDECASTAICIRDGTSSGASCRTTCDPNATSCEEGKQCTAIGAANVCMRPVETPDAGSDVQEQTPPPEGCGNCAAGGVEALALAALVALRRRRRFLNRG